MSDKTKKNERAIRAARRIVEQLRGDPAGLKLVVALAKLLAARRRRSPL